MSLHRKWFYDHVAQTSETALGLEVESAQGIYLYSTEGKKYMDLNSGISVSSLGHRHPYIIQKIKDQLDKYLHTMVYGEHIQTPQVEYAHLLVKILNNHLDNVYFVNSGSEAVEAALKLARKFTGRFNIISASNAYHGSTLGAESLRSDVSFTKHYMPSIPGVKNIRFNDEVDLKLIDQQTACVIVEPVQAEAGVIVPMNDYLKKIEKRCKEVGALFILDEIQTGFGRTGYFFAFQKYDVKPDILLLAKAMGGGMPIGALVAEKRILSVFASQPSLGHITTFGGHPVSVAGALGALEVLYHEDIICQVSKKEKIFLGRLQHRHIKRIRSSGLMMGVQLTNKQMLTPFISSAYHQGFIVDYFLFNDDSFRIAPPLVITEAEIHQACDLILSVLDLL
ncbi:MAG: aminotransferase class III-fold pyridoxal phosphate-dependent enzyme [Saprospiraceae bacterium]